MAQDFNLFCLFLLRIKLVIEPPISQGFAFLVQEFYDQSALFERAEFLLLTVEDLVLESVLLYLVQRVLYELWGVHFELFSFVLRVVETAKVRHLYHINL